MDGSQGKPERGARLVSMDEVCTLLDVERRTVERWIAKGSFPAPARIGENKVAFPLAALTTWAVKLGTDFAAEIERLAHTRATDLRPESVDKALAKRLSRQLGERVQAKEVVTGRTRPATGEDYDNLAFEACLAFEALLSAAPGGVRALAGLGQSEQLASRDPWSAMM